MMAGPVDPIRTPPPDLARASLQEVAQALAEQRLPPVEQWDPPHCGDSDMRIAADGTWFHGGTPIGRPAMVALFSTVLRREPDGGFVLVTPVEKLAIAVEDAPFVAVEAQMTGEGPARQMVFRLNTDHLVAAGPEHPIRIRHARDGTPRPYVHVRGSPERALEALINRPVFYQLADAALAEQERTGGPLGLWSGGRFFEFGG